MPIITIAPIVEGTSDTEAVSTLVQRYFVEEHKYSDIKILPALPAHGRSNITKSGGLEDLLTVAAIRIEQNPTQPLYELRDLHGGVPLPVTPRSGQKAILVMLDADEEACPGVFAKNLARRARDCRLPYPVAIVVAKRCFEAWLIASIDRIAERGVGGLRRRIAPPQNPEEEKDPKAWITQYMGPGYSYDPRLHQNMMTLYLNFHLSRRCRSFRRLLKTLDKLLEVATDPNIRRKYVMPDP